MGCEINQIDGNPDPRHLAEPLLEAHGTHVPDRPCERHGARWIWVVCSMHGEKESRVEVGGRFQRSDDERRPGERSEFNRAPI
jgi:hypothetical protein